MIGENCSIHDRCIWELAIEGAKANADTAIRRMEKAETRLHWAHTMLQRAQWIVSGSKADDWLSDYERGPEEHPK